MARSYFGPPFKQKPAPASSPSSTPPVFAGVTGVTPNTDGTVTVAWTAGTAVNPPIYYRLYIALGSGVLPAALFVDANVAIRVLGGTGARIYMLGDQATFLVKDKVYTVGVRAQDAYSNTETNVVTMDVTAIASGNLPVILQTTADSLDKTAKLLLALSA